MNSARLTDIKDMSAEQECSDMHIIQEWLEPDGHRLVIEEHGGEGRSCFTVLWLQDLSGDIGKVKEVGSFPTLVGARAAVRARLAALRETTIAA